MPLAPGSDQKTISSNISELTHHGSRPRSHEQIVAIALSNADRHPHRAAGGIGLSVRANPGIRTGGGGGLGHTPQVAKVMGMGEAMPSWTRTAAHDMNAPIHVGGGIGQRGHFATGGMMSMGEAEPSWTRSQARQINDVPFHSGLIDSAVPGRTDRLPLSVPSDSHIVPADAVSGVGQGNTKAGSNIWQAAIRSGPYGVAPPKAVKGPGVPHASSAKQSESGYADGGRGLQTSILAAGGEESIHPEQVLAIGERAIKLGWDAKGKTPMEFGHWLIDRAIKRVRDFNIKWLPNAPKPKT